MSLIYQPRYGFPLLCGLSVGFYFAMGTLPTWYLAMGVALFVVGTSRLWWLHWRSESSCPPR